MQTEKRRKLFRKVQILFLLLFICMMLPSAVSGESGTEAEEPPKETENQEEHTPPVGVLHLTYTDGRGEICTVMPQEHPDVPEDYQYFLEGSRMVSIHAVSESGIKEVMLRCGDTMENSEPLEVSYKEEIQHDGTYNILAEVELPQGFIGDLFWETGNDIKNTAGPVRFGGFVCKAEEAEAAAEITLPGEGSVYASGEIPVTFTVSVQAGGIRQADYRLGDREVIQTKEDMEGWEILEKNRNLIVRMKKTVLLHGEEGKNEIALRAEDIWGTQTKSRRQIEIDTEPPQLLISVLPDAGRYSAVKKSVQLRLSDRNLDERHIRAEVVQTSFDLHKKEVSVYVSKDWRNTGEGTGRTLCLDLHEEGSYRIRVQASDLAGNHTGIREIGPFVIDQTIDLTQIQLLEGQVRNKEELMLSVKAADSYPAEGRIQLLRTGAGGEKQDVTASFFPQMRWDGEEIAALPVPHERAYDGIYHLKLEMIDLAGNREEKTADFVINRFGSLFFFRPGWERLSGHYVQEMKEALSFSEVNPSGISDGHRTIEITRDGMPIENPRFEITETTQAGQWKSYEYRILKENFQKDGLYHISVTTLDDAGNRQDTGGLYKSFCVDRTAPDILFPDETHVLFQDSIGLRTCTVTEEDTGKVLFFKMGMPIGLYASGIFSRGWREKNLIFTAEDMAGNRSSMRLGKRKRPDDSKMQEGNRLFAEYIGREEAEHKVLPEQAAVQQERAGAAEQTNRRTKEEPGSSGTVICIFLMLLAVSGCVYLYKRK